MHAYAVTGPPLLALVTGWWRRARGFRRSARRIANAVCRCVCHLLCSGPDPEPIHPVAPVVAAPAAGAPPGSILLRHAIVLRAPPAPARARVPILPLPSWSSHDHDDQRSLAPG